MNISGGESARELYLFNLRDAEDLCKLDDERT